MPGKLKEKHLDQEAVASRDVYDYGLNSPKHRVRRILDGGNNGVGNILVA